jgi:hypothetical protein
LKIFSKKKNFKKIKDKFFKNGKKVMIEEINKNKNKKKRFLSYIIIIIKSKNKIN